MLEKTCQVSLTSVGFFGKVQLENWLSWVARVEPEFLAKATLLLIEQKRHFTVVENPPKCLIWIFTHFFRKFDYFQIDNKGCSLQWNETFLTDFHTLWWCLAWGRKCDRKLQPPQLKTTTYGAVATGNFFSSVASNATCHASRLLGLHTRKKPTGFLWRPTNSDKNRVDHKWLGLLLIVLCIR